MKISTGLADEAILSELGRRLARQRLDLQLTQAEAAAQAGVSKRTLERVEAGGSAQLSSLVRILRVLDALPHLENLLPEPGPSPMELLRRRGKTRKRASTRGRVAKKHQPWTWDDPA